MENKKFFEDAQVELIVIDDEDICTVSGFNVSEEDPMWTENNLTNNVTQ